jgi:UDP-N-acetylmuramyl pentapeptide phosphotransferase/UDP-N-acetylglucosamine-1-phosphate transferase
MTTFIGLLRDLVAAVLGVLIVFHVGISNDQESGILLVVTTGAALGLWLYNRRKSSP